MGVSPAHKAEHERKYHTYYKLVDIIICSKVQLCVCACAHACVSGYPCVCVHACLCIHVCCALCYHLSVISQQVTTV